MSDTENIVFKKGLGNLPLPNVENGSVLIETDSGRMYIDDNDVRTQISRKISSGEELPTEGVKEGDIFLKNGADNGEEDMFNLLYPIVNEHMNDTDNPHGVTWEQVGAAPAGYGLGVSTPQITLTDCNDGNYTGWYITTMSTTNIPLETGGWLRADMFNESYGTQTWYNDRYNGIVAQRFKLSGVWQPWEWVNPPMVAGEEYRTTERYNGKPVYAKFVDCGAMPNATIKRVYFSDVYTIVISLDCGGMYEGTSISKGHPFLEAWDTEGNTICIRTSYDRSDINCWAIVKYVKY